MGITTLGNYLCLFGISRKLLVLDVQKREVVRIVSLDSSYQVKMGSAPWMPLTDTHCLTVGGIRPAAHHSLSNELYVVDTVTGATKKPKFQGAVPVAHRCSPSGLVRFSSTLVLEI